MLTFENNILGNTDETVLIDRSEDHTLAALLMARQAERSIDIISRRLDPVVYNTPEFSEATKQLILKNRNSRVRILVHEPLIIVKHGHRLVDLALHLSSYMDIRVPNYEYEDFSESVFIADTCGYIHRTNAERFEGKLNFNDKRTSRILQHQFEQMWEKSRPDPNFKRALL